MFYRFYLILGLHIKIIKFIILDNRGTVVNILVLV
nr:MAG TPA: haloacid dehalogenase-like hydrolase [Caudoviricetes sp.]